MEINIARKVILCHNEISLSSYISVKRAVCLQNLGEGKALTMEWN